MKGLHAWNRNTTKIQNKYYLSHYYKLKKKMFKLSQNEFRDVPAGHVCKHSFYFWYQVPVLIITIAQIERICSHGNWNRKVRKTACHILSLNYILMLLYSCKLFFFFQKSTFSNWALRAKHINVNKKISTWTLCIFLFDLSKFLLFWNFPLSFRIISAHIFLA